MNLRHTDRTYESELHKLRELLLTMGTKVEEMIGASLRALVERDTPLARRTIDSDEEVDRLEIEVDELCLRILARRQPVASDLRLLTAALKLVTDLERIGDLGVNICERVIELNEEAPLKPYVDLPRMCEAVEGMVRQALDAFVAGDAERARRVIEQDNAVDAYYSQIFRELLTYMMEDVHNVYRATRLQSIAKHLERIGDHATNLAEEVVFMVKGKNIRHTHERDTRPARGILFLCLRNSARSQMAEGLARKLFHPRVKVFSAGSQPSTVNPRAIKVMREVGVELSGQRAKGLGEVPLSEVDYVVTLCAEEICPELPGGVRRESWVLPDPSAATGTEEEIDAAFRMVRDELQRRIETLART